MAERINACLVAGGRWHDIDFARLELLRLLAEHEHLRVKVLADYEDTTSITAGTILISYTCDVRPSEAAQRAIRAWHFTASPVTTRNARSPRNPRSNRPF